MTSARNRDDYPEVAEVLQSKKLRQHIKLRLYVLKMNHVLTEEDVINHVALCLVSTLRSEKPVPYPIAWARTVSERYINTQFDKTKNSQAADSEKIEYWANRLAEEQILFDDKEEIHQKLQQLKPGNRQILIWRFFEHLSWHQIAELLTIEEDRKISAATARKRGERALDELRKKYID